MSVFDSETQAKIQQMARDFAEHEDITLEEAANRLAKELQRYVSDEEWEQLQRFEPVERLQRERPLTAG